MSRHLYPGASTAARLTAACAVHSLFFFLDDALFDTTEPNEARYQLPHTSSPYALLVELLEIFKQRRVSGNASPIQRAFAELGNLVGKQCDQAWFHVFADGIRDYVDAVGARGPIDPSVEWDLPDFLDLRVRDTGGLHTCQLIELTNEAFLPSDLRGDPLLVRLTELAYRTASFVNDIFSYHKDVIIEGSRFNLVHILMRTRRVPLAEAVDEAVRYVNGLCDDFIAAHHELTQRPEPCAVAHRYADGLAQMMAGNVRWHATSPRYRAPDAAFAELRG